MTNDPLDNLEEYIERVRPQFEAELAELVDIPTVSSDPARTADMDRGIKLALRLLTKAGFTVDAVPTPGYPVVVARYVKDPAYPTVTIYNHMDVQPVNRSEWESDPFSLVVSEGRYVGRGATDDKGPALTALVAVTYALQNQIPLNFNVIWEFEEELGSTHFEDFLTGYAQKLPTSSVLVSDTIWISKTKPAIPVGLRGLVTFELSLRTGAKDVHSGLVGGAARNPIGELSQIITECYDATSGHIKIPGFYDDVRPLTAAERENLASAGFTSRQFLVDHELTSLRTEDDAEVMSRIMAEPTFEVHGIVGGHTGPGVKTAVPAYATAKLSARLVPGQDPRAIADLIRDFVAASHPDVIFTLEAAAAPYLGDVSGPYAQAAASAVEYAFGTSPAFVREGGTIGAVLSLSQILKAPVTLMGLSLPEHGYHAKNEYYDWNQASGGIKMFVKYFDEIARIA
ncbi:MAG TPA: M20/M25/M40 family metallo-hydrolase [Candidatus Saccharimonadia bacterium]|nr:M20/M25/M40 family metallo-hydrolase [Candidatus Saccharimonadia bacterium]